MQAAEQQRRLDEAEAALARLRDHVAARPPSPPTSAPPATPPPSSCSGEDLNRSVQAQALAALVTQDNADAVDQYRVVAEDAELARAALDATLAEQRDVVDSLRDRRQALDAELARLEELERQRREAEERRQREAAAAAAARSSRSGRTPGSGAVNTLGPDRRRSPAATGSARSRAPSPSSTRGARPARADGGTMGVDMMAAHGTPVVAPVSGNVSHRSNSIGGMSFHLNGDDGNYYYGTHLSGYANPGHVAAGTVIGYVGSHRQRVGARTCTSRSTPAAARP